MPQIVRPKSFLTPTLLVGVLTMVGCGEPIPNVAGGPPVPERQVIAQAVDTQGRVLRDRGVLVVETHGTLFQAGVQQGTLLRERIRDQLRDYHERRAFHAFALMPGFIHRFYAGRQQRHLTPDERDFIRGVTMGSGLSFDEVLLLSSEPPYSVLSGQLPGVLPSGGGFIARGKASRDGKALIGRISDDLSFGIRQRYGMLWVHRPDQGHAWVALTRVGSLAAEAAWSESGLYASIDPVPGASRAGGMPPRWLTLRLMGSAGPDAAEATLRQAAPHASQAFVGTLAQDDDARILEASGRQVGVRSYGSGASLADLAQSLGTFKLRGATKAAGTRDERLGKLLASSYGQIDASQAMTVLSDLDDPLTGRRGPTAFSISRSQPVRMTWGPLVMGDWGRLTSTAAIVSQPQDGRLWVALGKEQIDAPQNFVEFRLDDLLSGNDPANP